MSININSIIDHKTMVEICKEALADGWEVNYLEKQLDNLKQSPRQPNQDRLTSDTFSRCERIHTVIWFVFVILTVVIAFFNIYSYNEFPSPVYTFLIIAALFCFIRSWDHEERYRSSLIILITACILPSTYFLCIGLYDPFISVALLPVAYFLRFIVSNKIFNETKIVKRYIKTNRYSIKLKKATNADEKECKRLDALIKEKERELTTAKGKLSNSSPYAWLYLLLSIKATEAEIANVPFLPNSHEKIIEQIIDRIPYRREMTVEAFIDLAYKDFVKSKEECAVMKDKILSDAEYILNNIHRIH